MAIARGDAIALTAELVRIDSRNPSLVPGAAGEFAAARALCTVLERWGLDARLDEALPGRPNVVARVGRPGGRSLMFNGHIDVVGVEGMTHEPWTGDVIDGRMFGRGSADMKSGVAAMCAAAVRAVDRGLAGEIVIAAVVDEEFQSAGTRHLVASGARADAAIVTEPTSLAIMPAHKGFVWIELTVHGRAAHGSRWELGVDAIRHAALILAELDEIDATISGSRTHPLLGPPSLHASTIEGGTGMSTYPDRCVLRLERRTIPRAAGNDETADAVVAEVRAACDRVRQRHPELRADVRMMLAQAPSDVAVDAPIVNSLRGAMRACDMEARVEGMTAWTDAAILNEAGIPAICFGPGDIALAHAAEEYVPVDEIERATDVLTRLALDWCGGLHDSWRS